MSAQVPERPLPAWRKSSASDTGNACVEVTASDSLVLVRDSRDPGCLVIPVTPGCWREFVSRIKASEP